jgi:hypothetical protein
MPDFIMDVSLSGQGDLWHNFKTGQTDTKSSTWEPQDDEEAMQYIPQDSVTQAIYTAQRAMGYTIIDALQSGLERHVYEEGGSDG